jgi:L-fuculose-phosphate aldolase
VCNSGSMVHDGETKVVAEYFERIGKRLFAERLVGANFGNMSARSDEGFHITRSGSYLDIPGEPVYIPFNGEAPPNASNEYRVHRKIYTLTGHKAVIHAHPPYTIACSMNNDSIKPIDSEGLVFSPRISVVEGAGGSDELAERVAATLLGAKVVVARGHGTFAAGKNLDEAYTYTSLAEHSCRILLLIGKDRYETRS